MSVPFDSVGVVGLGVMGGSLVQALASLPEPPHVVGWSNDPEDLKSAMAGGFLNEAADSLDACVADVDVVVLAIPVDATCLVLGQLSNLARSDAVFHDVASMKAPVFQAAQEAGILDRWVGGHPMAGSEVSGFAGARPDLYRDARVWLVASEAAKEVRDRLAALWSAVGAAPEWTEAEAHDRLMAVASHLPQLTANALARIMESTGLSLDELGPGGRDTTRLAASGVDMWMKILAYAPDVLHKALRSLSKETEILADALEAGDLDHVRSLMETSRAWRQEP